MNREMSIAFEATEEGAKELKEKVKKMEMLEKIRRLEEAVKYNKGRADLLYLTLDQLVQAVPNYWYDIATDAALVDAMKEAASVLEL